MQVNCYDISSPRSLIKVRVLLFAGTPARLREGMVSGSVCQRVRMSVCPQKISKKLPAGNRCNLVGTCPTVNSRGDMEVGDI